MYTHIVSLYQVSYQQTAGWEPLFFFLPIWLPSLHCSCEESCPLCDCGRLCQFNCIILSNAFSLQIIFLPGPPVAREQSFATLFWDITWVISLLLGWPVAMTMMLRITPAMGGYGRRRDGHRWTGRLICLTFARGNALFIPLAGNHSSF